jgi:hypothetical protein
MYIDSTDCEDNEESHVLFCNFCVYFQCNLLNITGVKNILNQHYKEK